MSKLPFTMDITTSEKSVADKIASRILWTRDNWGHANYEEVRELVERNNKATIDKLVELEMEAKETSALKKMQTYEVRYESIVTRLTDAILNSMRAKLVYELRDLAKDVAADKKVKASTNPFFFQMLEIMSTAHNELKVEHERAKTFYNKN